MAPFIIITNVIFVGIWILYFKKPKIFTKKINALNRFDLSKKSAVIVFVSLLIVYIAASSSELASEEDFADYNSVKKKAQSWSIESINLNDVPLRFWFLSVSVNIFENIRLIPLLASLSLIVVTYLITSHITNNRFAGIVAMIFLMQSRLFLTYDTTATYENLWVLFYLVSLYFIVRIWSLSPVFYFLSIPLKTLTAAFFPISILYILRSKVKKKQKLLTLGTYGAIIIIGIVITLAQNINLVGTSLSFEADDFVQGFATIAFQLRTEGILLVFLPQLVFALFLLARKGFRNCEQVLIVIAGLLLVYPLVTGFTEQTAQPYRLVPLITFFAVGVGSLLTRASSEG